MSRYLAQYVLPMASGLPADAAVNTWAFESNSTGPVPGEVEDIILALTEFYENFDTILSNDIDDNQVLKIYDLEAPEPRVPLVEAELNVAMAGGTSLPHEVAVCLSFRGALVSGQPAARRKGRVFLGPLGTAALGVNGRPDSAVATALTNAVSAMYDEVLSASDVNHCVWSRAADNLYDVVLYTMDDEFDTQRRRGQSATVRELIYQPA